jgi:hypothetical protein
MTKATPKSAKRSDRTAQVPILGGPPLRPYPGVRSVPAKAIQRAVKQAIRERLAKECAATTET